MSTLALWLIAIALLRIGDKLGEIRKALSAREHGADAGTPVSGPSLCSPASPRAGDKGVGLEGKPPGPRRVGEPGNNAVTGSEARQ